MFFFGAEIPTKGSISEHTVTMPRSSTAQVVSMLLDHPGVDPNAKTKSAPQFWRAGGPPKGPCRTKNTTVW